MIKKLKYLLLTFIMVGSVAVPTVALASTPIQDQLACGTQLSAQGTSGCAGNTNASGSTDSVNKLIVDVINIFSWLVGGISVIMIIYGGFRYVTSGGNDQGVSGAKNTIVYALIGLVIVALAQVIVNFVLNKAFSVGG